MAEAMNGGRCHGGGGDWRHSLARTPSSGIVPSTAAPTWRRGVPWSGSPPSDLSCGNGLADL
jgi:hypothetical protein